MAGLQIPLGTRTTRPAASKNRFVHTVRPGRTPRSEQKQTIEEPLAIPEPTLADRIRDCQRKQANILARGGDVPVSMIRELANLLQEEAPEDVSEFAEDGEEPG